MRNRHTINDLVQRMTDYLSDTDSEPYGFTYMAKQIQKQFSDKIIITKIDGRPNVVTM